jgi:ribonuclease HII
MLFYEKKFKKEGYDIIVGVDEAGRGPLAGPVVAAAVFLKETKFKNLIDDSKKLTCRQRERAFGEIVKKSEFGIGLVDEKVIDRVNILQATHLAMRNAVKELKNKLRQKEYNKIYLLIDGNMKLDIGLPYLSIIQGDGKSKSIAAASILAKVTRDRIMSLYDKIYPQYGFAVHKGYPTLRHRLAIKKFGACSIHRVSFCGT